MTLREDMHAQRNVLWLEGVTMPLESFTVRNVKCDGCATNIRDGLLGLPGITTVDVDVATGHVTVEGSELARERLAEKLTALGYPLA